MKATLARKRRHNRCWMRWAKLARINVTDRRPRAGGLFLYDPHAPTDPIALLAGGRHCSATAAATGAAAGAHGGNADRHSWSGATLVAAGKAEPMAAIVNDGGFSALGAGYSHLARAGALGADGRRIGIGRYSFIPADAGPLACGLASGNDQ